MSPTQSLSWLPKRVLVGERKEYFRAIPISSTLYLMGTELLISVQREDTESTALYEIIVRAPSVAAFAPSLAASTSVLEASCGHESDRLDESMLCIICLDDAKVNAAVPCDHLLCCDTCADEVIQSKQCPLCRAHVTSLLKIYV